MHYKYQDFLLRPWQTVDRQPVADLISGVLAEYGLGWEPAGADRDVLEIEKFYLESGGAFWSAEQAGQIVGSGGYYPISRGPRAVEIRKMYLHPKVRGRGLGRFLLGQLEADIRQRGFQEIWIETATVLKEAVILYENHGYQPSSGVETLRCDRVYVKHL
jgi:putative acetyltransferase